MDIRNRDIVGCFPLLASVLGNKYGVTINIGGTEAYTNGKNIQIPALPVDLDADAVQIARGYVDHEAAHVRHTDFEALKRAKLDRTNTWLFNAIEDWRVENKLASLYPGCRQNFHQLLKRIFGGDDKAGRKNPALCILDYVLLTVRSWDVPDLTDKADRIGQLIQSHFPGLRGEIDGLLQKVRKSCPSTEAAIAHARAIGECIKKYLQDDNNKSEEDSSESEVKEQIGTEDESESDTSDTGSGSDAGGQEQTAPDTAADEQFSPEQEANEDNSDGCPTDSGTQSQRDAVEDSSDNGKEKFERCFGGQDLPQNPAEQNMAGAAESTDLTDGGANDLEALLSGGGDNIPQNLGDMLSHELEAMASESPHDDIVIAIEADKYTSPFSADERTESLRESVAMRQRLAGLLQARTLIQGSLGRRGQLDSSCLHRIYVGNARVFRRNAERIALDTAIHILLDCSSSMSDANMCLARKACYAIVRSLANTRGVNLALTAFPGDFLINSVYPVVRHGHRTKEIPCFSAAGSTPLGPALWYVIREMMPLQESRKIVLILTDGVPNSIPQAETAITQCENLHMEVMGIGMASQSIQYLLPKSSKVIWTLNELAPAMFDLVKTALLNGGAK